MLFFETSAKSGYNVDNMFEAACKMIIEKINKDIICINDEVIDSNPV
jgi:hypothetical protein